MASGGSEVASDELQDFKCNTCSHKVAVKYCIECQGYCCQSCVKTHSRFPTLKGHTFLDPNTTKEGGVSSSNILPTMPTERCNTHNVKLVDMYCKDHDKVGCTTCMALNHRSCSHVHSIPDDIDMLYEVTDIEETKRCLQISEKRLLNVEREKTEVLKSLDLSRKKADLSIDNAKREIILHVERLAKQSKAEVEKKFQTIKAFVEKERRQANENMDDLNNMSRDLNTSEGNKSQQFVCMKIANLKMKEAKETEITPQYKEGADILFDVDPSLQTFTRDFKTFGRVSCRNEVKCYDVETITDMNVKMQDDKFECNIFSSCLLHGGRIILTDCSNNKLKQVNIETMIIDSACSLDCRPFYVCCTKRDEAVVTFQYEKFIQFVSIGTKLTPSRKVNINHNCAGISYKDEKFYITDCAQTIYIHDMTGNELQTISTDSSGNSLFSFVRHISFSEYMRGSIVVVDQDKGVIILNDQYQRIAGYCAAALQAATSVCTDGGSSIFVCGYGSDNVLQIGYDGKKIGDLLDRSNGISKPLSLCFDSTRGRLVVSQGFSDIVKIIKFK